MGRSYQSGIRLLSVVPNPHITWNDTRRSFYTPRRSLGRMWLAVNDIIEPKIGSPHAGTLLVSTRLAANLMVKSLLCRKIVPWRRHFSRVSARAQNGIRLSDRVRSRSLFNYSDRALYTSGWYGIGRVCDRPQMTSWMDFPLTWITPVSLTTAMPRIWRQRVYYCSLLSR